MQSPICRFDRKMVRKKLSWWRCAPATSPCRPARPRPVPRRFGGLFRVRSSPGETHVPHCPPPLDQRQLAEVRVGEFPDRCGSLACAEKNRPVQAGESYPIFRINRCRTTGVRKAARRLCPRPHKHGQSVTTPNRQCPFRCARNARFIGVSSRVVFEETRFSAIADDWRQIPLIWAAVAGAGPAGL